MFSVSFTALAHWQLRELCPSVLQGPSWVLSAHNGPFATQLCSLDGRPLNPLLVCHSVNTPKFSPPLFLTPFCIPRTLWVLSNT